MFNVYNLYQRTPRRRRRRRCHLRRSTYHMNIQSSFKMTHVHATSLSGLAFCIGAFAFATSQSRQTMCVSDHHLLIMQDKLG